MLSAKDYIRYERHIELDFIGEFGQEKLLKSKVLLVGAGGLGCPISIYLCAAGVGHITIIDDDNISLSNLQRQILYGSKEIGEIKTETAKKKLNCLNDRISISSIVSRITEENVNSIVQNHDVVIDGSDNFHTRYLLNDSCVENKKPLISGSVLGFDGQVSVFKGYESSKPCYCCLYPHKAQSHEVPSCSESAVLNTLPGVIGTLMAIEVIKEILGIGKGLAGSLLIYDSLYCSFRKMVIDKSPLCSVCSHTQLIHESSKKNTG